VAWLSRLKEAQIKYKHAVNKQTHNSVSSEDSNTRRSRRSSSNVTHNDNIATTTTTTTTKSTGFSRARSPRDSRVSLGPTTLMTGHHRMVVPSASLNSAFWSSTSSDRRSTTSSLQSVSTFRGGGGGGAIAYGKTAISRTSSAGPAMRGIQEEDTEFWQLLQQQPRDDDDDDDDDDVERETAVGVGRRLRCQLSPLRLQMIGIKASLSRSCPCLSLAAVMKPPDYESYSITNPNRSLSPSPRLHNRPTMSQQCLTCAAQTQASTMMSTTRSIVDLARLSIKSSLGL